MTANTCRTCIHRETRPVLGMNRRNHYCAHPARDEDGSAVGEWVFNNKPNRCLPVAGARNCPGHERADGADQ